MNKLGFIGLGHLGAHLAASLLRAGFPLTVHDLNQQAAAGLLALGADWAASPQEMAAACDSIFTCLPSPAATQAVVGGPNGILAGARPGLTWIEMSTNDRHEIIRLAALAAERDVACLEAPVTGGVHKAASGEITILVGGEQPVFAAHLPALQAMGGKVFHMGPLGSASVIKVITNMLAFIHLKACAEALMLARRGGLDLGQAWQAIAASSGIQPAGGRQLGEGPDRGYRQLNSAGSRSHQQIAAGEHEPPVRRIGIARRQQFRLELIGQHQHGKGFPFK